jgi:ABC-type transport system involved in cytochrome c biogenesis permease subunit
MLIAVHTTMALSSASPVLPLIGQGIAYSLFAAVLWPSVTLVVEERLTGTAFGVMTSIQNIGLALFPMLIATIYNNSDERYIPHVELFFVACATVGSICSFGLIFLDRRTGRKLQSVTGMVPAAGGHDGDYGTHVGAA